METFSGELANNYFDRNPKFQTKKSIMQLGKFLKNEVLTNVFEVGCHTGAQLNYLSMSRGNKCKGYGMDLSVKAVEAGNKKYKELNLKVGRCPENFDSMVEDDSMDLIHFGFCFCYFSDAEYKESICIALKKLKKGKFLSIEDFDAVYVKKCQRDNILIHKRDYSTIEGLKLLEKKVFYDPDLQNNISYDNDKDRYSLWLFKKN